MTHITLTVVAMKLLSYIHLIIDISVFSSQHVVLYSLIIQTTFPLLYKMEDYYVVVMPNNQVYDINISLSPGPSVNP